MRQVAGRALWLGNAGDLRDHCAVSAAEIGAVVELADNEQLAVLPRELVRCRFPLSDGGDNPIWLLRLASKSVAALLRAEVPVLVCCSAGMSRSVCVAAAGIALAEGRPFDEALSLVVGVGPADVSPRLLVQCQEALGG
jgi:protein-tyrosine phosphatase